MEDQTFGVATALIYKIQTLTDGGLRLTLDLSESDLKLIQNLLAVKASSEPVVTVCFMPEVTSARG